MRLTAAGLLASMIVAGFLMVSPARSAHAQSSLQGFQKKADETPPTKGRFLRRLRDEIRGKDDDKDDDDKKAIQPPTSARPPAGFNPYAAQQGVPPNAWYGMNRPQAGPQSAYQSPGVGLSYGPNAYDPRRANPDYPANDRGGAVGAGVGPNLSTGGSAFGPAGIRNLPTSERLTDRRDQERTSKKAPDGFGLRLDVRNEQLVVIDVERKGNADQAGIKRGDILTSVGGFPIQSVEEFDQITEILKDGDSIEMEVSRRGKSEPLTVAFGQPIPDAMLADNVPRATDETAPAAPPLETRLSDLDFAPPLVGSDSSWPVDRDTNAPRSVLDNESLPTPSAVPAQSLPNPDDIRVLKSIIEQQQQQIETLRRELDQMRRGSSRRSTFSPPTGI